MLLKAKEIRNKVKALGKQINKDTILLLNKHINDYLDKILAQQKEKRITEKTIQL